MAGRALAVAIICGFRWNEECQGDGTSGNQREEARIILTNVKEMTLKTC